MSSLGYSALLGLVAALFALRGSFAADAGDGPSLANPLPATEAELRAALPEASDIRPTDMTLLASLLEKRGYTPPDTFKALVVEIEETAKGLFTYYPMDFLGTSKDRDDWWPASSVKLFAAVAALERARAMGFTPNAGLTFHYPDAEAVTQTMEELVRRAITDSKNPEFDRLVELVGSDRLNRYFLTRAKGLERTVMLRAYSRRVLHPETQKSLNSHSPPITVREGKRVREIEERLRKGDYPCDNNGNCTTLEELAEAARRVMMHETLPQGERYKLGEQELFLLRSAMKGQRAKGGVADGLRAAFKDRPIEIYHKGGYADGWFNDNVFLRVNDTNERWQIAMANRPGRDCLNDAALHVAELIASGELSKERKKRFAKNKDASSTRVSSDVEVLPREAWGAVLPLRPYVRHRIEKLTVHHQGVVFENSKLAPKRMRTMQEFHQSAEKGFLDIAYHFVIDPEGNIYQGRPVWAKGETETDYDPAGHLLVCLLGDFESQKPTPDALSSLASILAWAAKTYGVTENAIQGHRDHAHTTCPGKHLHSLIADGTLKSRVKALMESEMLEMRLVGGDEGEERIMAIRRGDRTGGVKRAP